MAAEAKENPDDIILYGFEIELKNSGIIDNSNPRQIKDKKVFYTVELEKKLGKINFRIYK